MGYKLKRILIYPDGVTEKQVYPAHKPEVYFDFGDWTNSTWTATRSGGGTVNKTSSSVSFTTGTTYSAFGLTDYPIDATKDFLLEINCNVPNTSVGTHTVGLYDIDRNNPIDVRFGTAWQSSYKNKMRCLIGGSWVADGGANPGTADFFIRKEGSVLTMGWNNTTVYTDNNCSIGNSYYLYEQVYNSTLTIYTAKLTYL